EATRALMSNRGIADIEKEIEARATFESKLKLNKTVDSLLVNLLARKNAWSFGQGEERIDVNLAALMHDLQLDPKRTFAHQSGILKKRVNDVDAASREAALKKMREYWPTWEQAKKEPNSEVQLTINERMQSLQNEYYKADLDYKRE